MNVNRMVNGGMTSEQFSRFRKWVRQRQSLAGTLPLDELIRLSRIRISHSAAYRAALLEGARGHRHNQTRLAKFWLQLNWHLPDTALAVVWGVDRANLRARRVRLRVGKPLWKLPSCTSDHSFLAALRLERTRARRFRGDRPACGRIQRRSHVYV